MDVRSRLWRGNTLTLIHPSLLLLLLLASSLHSYTLAMRTYDSVEHLCRIYQRLGDRQKAMEQYNLELDLLAAGAR